MEQERDSTRLRSRIPLTLPIRVCFTESPGHEWIEQSRLIDVSHFGAGFTLTRPVDPGRIILLSIPLPQQLRCFDHAEPQYSVWSLVRHAAAIRKAQQQQSPLFRVGVAFLGKRPPRAYEEDPTLRYEPLPVEGKQTTMWQVSERRPDKHRRETRLILPLEVIIEALDENGRPCLQEHTVTETLSSLGACVPTNLNVGVGRILRVSSERDDVSIFATIRSRELASDGTPDWASNSLVNVGLCTGAKNFCCRQQILPFPANFPRPDPFSDCRVHTRAGRRARSVLYVHFIGTGSRTFCWLVVGVQLNHCPLEEQR